MSRHILMIAFQYPPFGGSSGVHRALSFSRELPGSGWAPVVLAPSERAYEQVSHDLDHKVPDDVPVHRTFALDASRHLSIGGRYLGWTALPDQWSSWWISAVARGLWLIRKYRPAVLWSTYPISTAHLIALALHRLTGIPWVADFRDPMVYESWPVEPGMRRVRLWVERLVIKHCTRAVFVTESARQLYVERYHSIPESRFRVIGNGYDEDAFSDLGSVATQRRSGSSGRPLVFVHSGLLEQSDRDPTPFFQALAELQRKGIIHSGELRVILRDSGSDEIYQAEIDRCGLGELVFLEARIPYAEALSEMLSVDGLLIFQGSDCNRQIPAKIYEYVRARRPILAMVDPAGETAALLKGMGVSTTARLDDKDEIERQLMAFIDLVRRGEAPIPTDEIVASHSRQWKARELAMLLDEVSS